LAAVGAESPFVDSARPFEPVVAVAGKRLPRAAAGRWDRTSVPIRYEQVPDVGPMDAVRSRGGEVEWCVAVGPIGVEARLRWVRS